MNDLKFSHSYDKLYLLNDGHVITTIRRRNKFKVAAIVRVITNGKFLCNAKIMSILKTKIKHIDDPTLLNDVSPQANNRLDAIAFINTFYKIPLTEDSEVFIYNLIRSD